MRPFFIISILAIVSGEAELGFAQPIYSLQNKQTPASRPKGSWSTKFGYPEIFGNITDLKVNGSRLYATGGFLAAGGIPGANGIAYWDGASWNALGEGLIGGEVYCMVIVRDTIYAGGVFRKSFNDTTIRYIAKWDGWQWEPLGAGINAPVFALAADSIGNIYAGGAFLSAGGVSGVHHITKWDGNIWSKLGNGTSDRVYSIAVNHKGEVFAGGEFTSAGDDTNARYVAKWDGNTWTSLANGPDDRVYTISCQKDTLYAQGYFRQAGGDTNANSFAKWDGNQWYSVGHIGGGVYNFHLTRSNRLFVCGYFPQIGGDIYDMLEWDGQSWKRVPVGHNVMEMTGEETIYIAGQGHIDAWSGPTWTRLLNNEMFGVNGSVGAVASSGDTLYIGGWFTSAPGDTAAKYIARWDGNKWQSLGQGVNGPVWCLHLHNGNLYAGGRFTSAGGDTSIQFLGIWNGQQWSKVGNGLQCDYLSNVAAISSGGQDLYVGGRFNSADGLPYTRNFAKWDGQSWSSLGKGVSLYHDDKINTIAIASDGVYVGGWFVHANGEKGYNNVAKWNFSSWEKLGEGTNGEVTAMVMHKNNIIVSGRFDYAGLRQVMHPLAQWDGTSWSALGPGLEGLMYCGLSDGDNLYLGGINFIDTITLLSRIGQGVIVWDGTLWSELGGGVDGLVRSIVANGSDTYVGGEFNYVGGGFKQGSGIQSFNLALYSSGLGDVSRSKLSPLRLDVTPNPSSDHCLISFTNERSCSVSIEIYDLLGSKVRHWSIANAEGGNHHIDWNRRSDNGVKVSSGIYLCKLKIGATEVATTSIVLQ